MTTENTIPEFSFRKPTVYKIIVQGVMDGSWSERLGGLQINVERVKGKNPVTVLTGQMKDQAALSGVLNTLYDFQHTIISVSMLKDEQ
ncbi:MAG: hypothetical protein KAI99_11970 [Cyclobacteriaceae bacterium]|nr:hypothetical protein [Cyclobacteriaceae bacterium]